MLFLFELLIEDRCRISCSVKDKVEYKSSLTRMRVKRSLYCLSQTLVVTFDRIRSVHLAPELLLPLIISKKWANTVHVYVPIGGGGIGSDGLRNASTLGRKCTPYFVGIDESL